MRYIIFLLFLFFACSSAEYDVCDTQCVKMNLTQLAEIEEIQEEEPARPVIVPEWPE